MFFSKRKFSDEILDAWKELYKTKYTQQKIIKSNLLMMFVIGIVFGTIILIIWGYRSEWKYNWQFWVIFAISMVANASIWLWQIYNKLQIWKIVNIDGDDAKLYKFINRVAGRIGPSSGVQELESYKAKQTLNNDKQDK